MMTIDYKRIEEIVREAGDTMLEGLTADEVHDKGGAADFVTDKDVAIQKFIISKLQDVIPEATYYGEEATEGSEQRVTSDFVFYIDPIDGTTNFMVGYKHSCVSVGLAYQGKIIAGFVYDPFVNDMYVGINGQPTTLNGKTMKLDDNKTISQGIAGFDATRYNEGEGPVVDLLFDVVKAMFRKSIATREGGSAALDLCRCSSGANTVYFQFVLKPYDFAAAIAIVEGAGGVITQMNGEPLVLEGTCSCICGNKAAWAEAKEMIEELSKNYPGVTY